MNSLIWRTLATAAFLGILASGAQAADGLLGFQVGASAGQAGIRVDRRPDGVALDLKENHSAWKAFVGVRPLSLIGAELSYFDLGKANANFGSGSSAVNAQTRQSGTSLFAVGYLPLPLPLLDIYAKVGVARIQTDLEGDRPGLNCIVAGCGRFHGNSRDNKFAWGLGTQIKLPVTSLGVRAEYEQFRSNNGDPHLVTLGVVWNP